jgi:hypothetical protein
MSLSILSILVGIVFLPIGLLGLVQPERLTALASWFPRSAWPGRLLAAVALPWAAYFQLITPPVAGHALFTNLVMWSVPLAFLLILIYLKELLSIRALGGILLLAATPLLKQARLHESSLSIFVTLVTYALIVVGIIWVLSPFRFRHWFERCSATPSRLRNGSLVCTFLGGLFVILGLFVY